MRVLAVVNSIQVILMICWNFLWLAIQGVVRIDPGGSKRDMILSHPTQDFQ